MRSTVFGSLPQVVKPGKPFIPRDVFTPREGTLMTLVFYGVDGRVREKAVIKSLPNAKTFYAA